MFPLLLRQYVVTIEGFDRVVMEKVTKQKIMLNLIFLLLPKCNVDNDSTKKYNVPKKVLRAKVFLNTSNAASFKNIYCSCMLPPNEH